MHLRVALGSRTVTSTALTRHLAGTATVLGAEDLRFRTWEVEELFRTCHGTRLRADEVADLAHRTGGWAAGLELFHLATHGRPPSSRARLLGVGGGQLSSDYLARHVLDQVPAPLRDFLVRTAVLATLTAARCDELLGSTDAAALLEQAHRLGLLNAVADAESHRLRLPRGHARAPARRARRSGRRRPCPGAAPAGRAAGAARGRLRRGAALVVPRARLGRRTTGPRDRRG